ncbi:adenylate/guanylate cyclase domain-containing protein [Spirochaeta cellobiosiphila]|uniref:adenylate/guanylate cyclase domain-containing protein n=1 Tax=Spirochaeta cellobiosiphila TaxID=504483 RepID=UPI0004084E23|nr:adenylate/guanylate cyclase domain-containing protein [Spirochaeta cellobiosiphila]
MKKHKAFRVGILELFLPLLLVTSLSIITLFYIKTKQSSLKLAKIIVNSASNRIKEKTISFLEPATSSVAILGGILEGDPEYLDSETTLRTMWELVKSNQQIYTLYIADKDGNFIQARQEPGRAIRHILRSKGTVEETWEFKDDDYVTIKELDRDGAYDPRNRPWYVKALTFNKLSWSDLYVFSSNRKPGVTASMPVTLRNDKNLVLGADITLSDLGHFLQQMSLTEGTQIVLTTPSRQIIASNQTSLLYTGDKEDFSAYTLDALEDKTLVNAYKASQEKDDQLLYFKSDNLTYYTIKSSLPSSLGFNWNILIVIPTADVLGPIKSTLYLNLGISFCLLFISLLFLSYLSKKISKPIILLAKETEHIKGFHLERVRSIESPFKEVHILNQSILSMTKGLTAFGKYVPSDIVRQLIQTKKEARLGGERQELTLFFSSINGFTKASESLTPESLFLHLSDYMEQTSQIIMNHEGTIDKYIGDTIMAFWGAPLPQENHVFNALKASLALQELIHTLNSRWLGEVKPIMDTRIGIHTGPVMVGNVGSRDRMNYTVLGHSVNIASRLEGLNKYYGTDILVSEDTYLKGRDHFAFVPIDDIRYNKTEKITLYWLLGEGYAENLSPHKKAIHHLCWKVYDAYHNQNWSEARAIYEELREYPLTKPLSTYMIPRIDRHK